MADVQQSSGEQPGYVVSELGPGLKRSAEAILEPHVVNRDARARRELRLFHERLMTCKWSRLGS